jgi:preprotein translocase subunit SecF
VSSATDEVTAVVAEPQTSLPTRRGLGGRLYHGETAIDFYGRRWWGLGFSGVLLVVTTLSLAFSGLNLGIDFEGGVAWEVPSANLSEDQARDVLVANGVDDSAAKVQELSSPEAGSRLRIQVADQSPQVVAQVQQQLATAAGVDVSDVTSTSVSSSWGESITEKAVRALVIFLVLVMLFITWRFEWRMALASIAAMVHDVLITVGVYSLFGFEVTPATVVAFLTILGYSLYDTIVVFDKVRENTERYASARAPYADIINVSMNQVLMRTLNTSISSALPVLSLLIIGSGFLGAVSLREFALALLVGILTGSYSSIFIATPLLGMLHEREPRYRSLRGSRATGAELERLVLGGSPTGHRRESARTRRTGAEALVGAPGTPAAPVAPVAPVSPKDVLTHAPRPRKKKRR